VIGAWLAAAAAAGALAVWRGRPPARRLAGGLAPRRRSGIAGLASILTATLLVGLAARLPFAIVGLVAGAAAGGWRGFTQRARARERERCSAAVIEVTFALAAELRAGRTPAQALGAVAAIAGPLEGRLASAHAAVAAGGSAADELDRAAELPGAERIRYVAETWRVTETAGGRVARVLERLGEAMDGDEQLRRDLDAALAGPRATMLLLAVLPAFGVALGQAMGARPVDLLVHRPVGWALVGGATGLDAVGVWLIRRITTAAARC
jgi:tight adherence protein B